MTLEKWVTAEIINAEEALEQYRDSPDPESYWTGVLHTLNNTLDFLEGAAVYSEAVS